MTASYLDRRGVVIGGAALVVGVFIFSTSPAAAVGVPPTHIGHVAMDGGHMQGLPGPFFWWMPFAMPALWLGLLAAVAFLSYRFISSVASTDSAMEALDRAFARGELSDEEYERRRERLGG